MRRLPPAALPGAAGAWAVALCACGPPPPAPLPPDSFAFAVFGDGPYYAWERGRYRRVLDDVAASGVAWLLHVGDLFWYPCSDQAMETRRLELDAQPLPVVYTPGDNEWTDCHEDPTGTFEPLGRLARLREIYFARPDSSLGGRPMAVVSQAAAAAPNAEFPENVRWTRGGFVFATLHVVGSGNGSAPFPGRTRVHDAEVERRTRAAVAWLDETFAVARETDAAGVVLATHASMGLGEPAVPGGAFEPILAALLAHTAAFAGSVLLIHGDSHQQRVDRPLHGGDGQVLERFTRLETFGSPEIGWIRVVVDTAQGRIVAYEPRLMRGWW